MNLVSYLVDRIHVVSHELEDLAVEGVSDVEQGDDEDDDEDHEKLLQSVVGLVEGQTIVQAVGSDG